jgi:hypothetical protein
MSQIESLTAFITANLPNDVMQMFESSQDNCELIRSSKALGLEQKRIGLLRYDATLSWDRFPFRVCSPGLVYALVLTWVSEHANEYREQLQLPDPTVDPEFDDEGYCILQVVVPMADPIILKEDQSGDVPAQGKRWSLVDPEIWTAKEVEFVTQRVGDA